MSEKNANWEELKQMHWEENIIVDTQEWGYIDFSPKGKDEVVGGEKLTYEEYLDAQMAIGKNIRGGFSYVTTNHRLASWGRSKG